MFYFFFSLSSRKYLIQAMSEEDRKSWLEIMEGKEPVYSSLKVIECKYLNPVFTNNNIYAVEVQFTLIYGILHPPPPPPLSVYHSDCCQ